MAFMCRQTNIIWVFFVAGSSVIKDFEIEKYNERNDLFSFARYVLRNFLSIIVRYKVFVAVGVSFLLFVHQNQGIVVGMCFPSLFKLAILTYSFRRSIPSYGDYSLASGSLFCFHRSLLQQWSDAFQQEGHHYSVLNEGGHVSSLVVSDLPRCS